VAQWVRPCEPVVGASCRQYGQVDGITPLKACCGQFSGRHFSVAVPESGFRVNVMLGLARGSESMELHEMAKTLPCKIAMDDWLEEDVSDPHHPGCRFVGPAFLQPPLGYAIAGLALRLTVRGYLCLVALHEFCVLQF
jgi:hypothetical protein